MNRLGDSGVHTLGDNSAFVNPGGGQLLLTRRVKTRMDGFGIVFDFYIAPLYKDRNNFLKLDSLKMAHYLHEWHGGAAENYQGKQNDDECSRYDDVSLFAIEIQM